MTPQHQKQPYSCMLPPAHISPPHLSHGSGSATTRCLSVPQSTKFGFGTRLTPAWPGFKTCSAWLPSVPPPDFTPISSAEDKLN